MFNMVNGEQELIWQHIGIPPFESTGATSVPVYTYKAHWLALQSLWDIACLETELLELFERSENLLNTSEHWDNDLGHEQTQQRIIQEQIGSLLIHWSIALLELVFLYRLHCDVVNPNRLQHSAHRIHHNEHREAASLSGTATAVLACSVPAFNTIKNCLEKHHMHHTGAAMPYAGTEVPGSPLECADALQGFMRAACKVEHSHGLPAWIHEEAQQVLIFFAAQVRHELYCYFGFAHSLY